MSDRHPAGGPPASRTRWDVDENEQTSTDRTLDARLGAVVRELRRPVGVDAALDRRVMQAVAAGPHPVRGAGAAVDDRQVQLPVHERGERARRGLRDDAHLHPRPA